MKRFRSLLMGMMAAVAVAGCGEISEPTAAGTPQQSLVSSISYSIDLTNSGYDAAADETTFEYEVTSEAAPAISHWVLALPESADPVVARSSDPATSVGTDATTGVYGAKFDTGYTEGEQRTVTVVLEGEWSVGEVTVAVKAGDGFVTGVEQGPVVSEGGGTVTAYAITGTVYFDIDGNGSRDADENGVGGITVSLTDEMSTTTAADGSYRLAGLPPGSYTVAATPRAGTSMTSAVAIDLTADATADFGLTLQYDALCGELANGFTIGYWKNNLGKLRAGKTKGLQVTAAEAASYVATVSDFALSPFAGITLNDAIKLLGAKGSNPAVILSKQLLAAELNYASGAYIGGDEVLTGMFLTAGEYMLKNAGRYGKSDLVQQKNWYDAYNNTHGGPLAGAVCGD